MYSSIACRIVIHTHTFVHRPLKKHNFSLLGLLEIIDRYYRVGQIKRG